MFLCPSCFRETHHGRFSNDICKDPKTSYGLCERQGCGRMAVCWECTCSTTEEAKSKVHDKVSAE